MLAKSAGICQTILECGRARSAILLPALTGAASRAPLPAAMRLVPPTRVDGLGREAAKGGTLGHAGFALLIGWLPLAIMFGVGGLLALTRGES